MVKLIKTFPLNYDYIIEKEINDIKRIPDNEIISKELSDIESDNDKIDNNKINCNEKNCLIDKDNNKDGGDIYEKIDDKFISYEKKYNLDKSTWWPVNLRYEGKKYSLMTKKYLLTLWLSLMQGPLHLNMDM